MIIRTEIEERISGFGREGAQHVPGDASILACVRSSLMKVNARAACRAAGSGCIRLAMKWHHRVPVFPDADHSGDRYDHPRYDDRVFSCHLLRCACSIDPTSIALPIAQGRLLSFYPCSIPKRSDEAGGIFQAGFSDGANGLGKCGEEAGVMILKLRSCPAVCVEDGRARAITREEFIENSGAQV